MSILKADLPFRPNAYRLFRHLDKYLRDLVYEYLKANHPDTEVGVTVDEVLTGIKWAIPEMERDELTIPDEVV